MIHRVIASVMSMVSIIGMLVLGTYTPTQAAVSSQVSAASVANTVSSTKAASSKVRVSFVPKRTVLHRPAKKKLTAAEREVLSHSGRHSVVITGFAARRLTLRGDVRPDWDWVRVARARARSVALHLRSIGFHGSITRKIEPVEVAATRSSGRHWIERKAAAKATAKFITKPVTPPTPTPNPDKPVFTIGYQSADTSQGSISGQCGPSTYTTLTSTLTPSSDSDCVVTPATGYEFNGWSPASYPAGTNGDLTFRAQWTEKAYALSYDSSDDSKGTVSGTCGPASYTITSPDITPGTTSPCVLTPRAGYQFTGWSPTGTTTGSTGDTTFQAQWSEQTYSLTYQSSDDTKGTVSGTCGPDSYTISSPDITPATTSPCTLTPQAGYQFTGWSPTGTTTGSTGDITFQAQWSEQSYSLSYESSDNTKGAVSGTCGPGSYTVTSPDITPGTTSPCILTPEAGYEFDSWSPASITTGTTGNQTFQAQWSEQTYSVTYQSSDDTKGSVSGTCGPDSYTITSPDITPATTSPCTLTPEAGYEFDGWSPASITTGTTGNQTFQAQWTEVYSITYQSSDDTEGTVSGTCGPTTYTVNSADITPLTGGTCVLTPKTGYDFAGWSPTSITTGTTGNQTFEAQWSEHSYSITYQSSDTNKGTVSGDCGPSWYTINSPTITPLTTGSCVLTPAPGYEFASWSPTSISSGSTGDTTFQAQWSEVAYTITYASSGNGTVSGDCGPASYTVTTADINPKVDGDGSCALTPDSGYVFAGWSPASIPTGSTGSKTFTAQFAVPYSITYQSADDTKGTVSGTCGPDTYTAASPDITPLVNGSCILMGSDPYVFAGWSPASIPTGSTGNKTFTANWVDPTQAFNLTYVSSDTGQGTVSGTCGPATYTFNTPTFTALIGGGGDCTLTPAPGYVFNGWSPAIVPKGSTGDKVVQAQWKALPTTSCADYNVGDTGPSGGIIYYKGGDPLLCLEVAPEDIASPVPAGCWGVAAYSGNYPDIGVGEQATQTLIYYSSGIGGSNGCYGMTGSTPAWAAQAANTYVSPTGFSNWALPSKDELNQLCRWAYGESTGPTETGVCNASGTDTLVNGNFSPRTYQSTTFTTAYWFDVQNFANGTQSGQAWRNANYYVRPIRSFP